jgi:hypothetical protein
MTRRILRRAGFILLLLAIGYATLLATAALVLLGGHTPPGG